LFPAEIKNSRDAFRAGTSVKSWSDAAKLQIRDGMSRGKPTTLVVRPQVLMRYDPKLIFLNEILGLAHAVGATPQTLREMLVKGGP
jgi:hypothetical protein